MKALKRVLIFLLSVLAVLLIAIGGLNLAKRAIYPEYYENVTDLCVNPGINDGFMCQGICVYEETNQFIVSGYMADGSASRLYITNFYNNSYYVTIKVDGEDFYGHSGGVACFGENVFVVSDRTIFVLSLSDVLMAENGDSVNVIRKVGVNNSASFVYSDEHYLYVGEFHGAGPYKTNNKYQTPDGENHAIVSRYSHYDLTKPNKVYSIRDKVQGICFTPDGKIVLSTSYGLADSVYYVYNESDCVYLEQTLDGAPVYALTNCIKELKGPAMSEGLDYYEGKVITLTESASNKYIFGKFFGADKIVALEID